MELPGDWRKGICRERLATLKVRRMVGRDGGRM